MADINSVIAAKVRAWPDWSRAEQRRMDAIVEEVLDHCRNGTGNKFVREWCRRNLTPADVGMAMIDAISIPFPGPSER